MVNEAEIETRRIRAGDEEAFEAVAFGVRDGWWLLDSQLCGSVTPAGPRSRPQGRRHVLDLPARDIDHEFCEFGAIARPFWMLRRALIEPSREDFGTVGLGMSHRGIEMGHTSSMRRTAKSSGTPASIARPMPRTRIAVGGAGVIPGGYQCNADT
jgi:hypothetical protein